MSESADPIKVTLKLALSTLKKHHTFYEEAGEKVSTPEVKALLLLLTETERELIDRIEEMLYEDGIIGLIGELSKKEDIPPPDDTPFDPSREDTDSRIFVCNKALEMELKAYLFFLSFAARANSEMVSQVFEYFAYVKNLQIEKIRRVCSTF